MSGPKRPQRRKWGFHLPHLGTALGPSLGTSPFYCVCNGDMPGFEWISGLLLPHLVLVSEQFISFHFYLFPLPIERLRKCLHIIEAMNVKIKIINIYIPVFPLPGQDFRLYWSSTTWKQLLKITSPVSPPSVSMSGLKRKSCNGKLAQSGLHLKRFLLQCNLFYLWLEWSFHSCRLTFFFFSRETNDSRKFFGST